MHHLLSGVADVSTELCWGGPVNIVRDLMHHSLTVSMLEIENPQLVISKCMQLRKPCRNFGLWLSRIPNLPLTQASCSEIGYTVIKHVDGGQGRHYSCRACALKLICHALMRHLIVRCCARLSASTIRSSRCGASTASYMRTAATSADSNTFNVIAPLEQGTKGLAVILAGDARVGDCVCLHGEVGAGKSVFRSAT